MQAIVAEDEMDIVSILSALLVVLADSEIDIGMFFKTVFTRDTLVFSLADNILFANLTNDTVFADVTDSV